MKKVTPASQTVPPKTGHQLALLVIDIQAGLFAKSTKIYQAAELLERSNRLIAGARQCGAALVFIQHSSPSVLPYGSDGWQFHPALALQPGDAIVHKTHGNAFEDTGLEAQLDALNVGAVVVTGLVSHGCVKATCLGAQALGYRVILAGDAHSSYSAKAAQLITETNAALAGEVLIRVLPVDEIAF